MLTTLHTNSAPESIVRLIDMGMDPFNFADALVGVMSQRLVRTLCTGCKKPHRASDGEVDELCREYLSEMSEGVQIAETDTVALIDRWRQEFGSAGGDITLYSAPGCDECDNSGYRGRLGVYELLEGTRAIKKHIIESSPVAVLRATAQEEGMRTLKQDGIEKILQGHTDLTQVRKVSTG